VATLHDANHLALPQHYGRLHAAYYRAVVAPRAERAKALITISEFSRTELSRTLGLSPYRFQVISQGVDARFAPQPPHAVAAFRRARGLPERFVLAVGSEKPHKNLARLGAISGSLPLPFVLLAGPGAARRLGFCEGTVEFDSVEETAMPLLYAAADALAFPSVYEGFGLPVLEAMAVGCPVVATRGSSIPEVCGEAALLVEDTPQAWREALMRIGRDERLRRELSENGPARAARFTWDVCARQTLAVYRRALEQAR
jgi:glycosyltransferase involved in cell wall biosynthesis